MPKLRTSLIILFLISLSACNLRAVNQPAITATNIQNFATGWNTIDAAGSTICSDGSPYKFFFRPGATAKLMLYFQGGGACWSGKTCDPDLGPSYKINLDKVKPDLYSGVLDFSNPENPLRDYSVVFVPYCSADVHIGDAVANYEAPTGPDHQGHRVRIEHRGYINSAAAMDWVFTHFHQPENIFVTGSSAGAIPSPYYAMLVADHYANTRVTQLGDGAGGYRINDDNIQPHKPWGTLKRLLEVPELADLESRPFGFEDLYIAAAQRYPKMQLAQYDTAEDKVQKLFLNYLGIDNSTLLPLLLANHADIRSDASNFNTYIAGGDLHTILLRPEFYSYHVNGLRVRDWVANLVNDIEVTDVQCKLCDTAETLAVDETRN